MPGPRERRELSAARVSAGSPASRRGMVRVRQDWRTSFPRALVACEGRCGSAQALIAFAESPAVISTLRGLAFSAMGIRRVSTPAS